MNTYENIYRGVEKAVEKITGVKKADFTANTRRRDLCEVRFILWYVLRYYYSISLSAIGERYSKNHAAILNGCTNIVNAEKYNRPLWDTMRKVIQECQKKGVAV